MIDVRVWKEGEKLAQKYLKKQGYKIKLVNFSIAGVELDIVSVLPVSVQKINLKKELLKRLKTATTNIEKVTLKNNFKNYSKTLEPILVITEVKARSNEKFGEGWQAVGTLKQNHIKRGTNALLKSKEFKGMSYRFDIASVDNGKLTYYENAF